jgi:hypothetical protein
MDNLNGKNKLDKTPKSSIYSKQTTPNQKNIPEQSPIIDGKSHQKMKKSKERAGVDYTNSQTNSFENSNKKNKTKSIHKNAPTKVDDYPYNEFVTAEYKHPQELSRHAKINHYQSSHDQVNYESLHPNDLEGELSKFQKDDSNYGLMDKQGNHHHKISELDLSIIEDPYVQPKKPSTRRNNYEHFKYESYY